MHTPATGAAAAEKGHLSFFSGKDDTHADERDSGLGEAVWATKEGLPAAHEPTSHPLMPVSETKR